MWIRSSSGIATNYQDVEGVARCVPLDEIKENDWNLNIPRYIEPVIEEETITVAEAIENLKTNLNAAYDAEDKLKALLVKSGLLGSEQIYPQRSQRFMSDELTEQIIGAAIEVHRMSANAGMKCCKRCSV